jgi:hypothetical protein
MIFTLQTIQDRAYAIVVQFFPRPDADSLIAHANAVKDATEDVTADTTLDDQEDQLLETFNVSAMSECIFYKTIFKTYRRPHCQEAFPHDRHSS